MHRAKTRYLIFFFSLTSSCIFGQWKQLSTFNSQIVSIKFLSNERHPEIGFVGLSTGEVWRTINGGSSWTKAFATVPITGKITSFAFKDSLVGWLSMADKTSKPCVYKTTDGGQVWVADTISGIGTSITYNAPFRMLVLTTWSGNTMVSTNEGARWLFPAGFNNSISIPEAMCGVTYCTPAFGVMTGAQSEPIYTTSNGGLTWRKAQVLQEMWHPHGIPGSNTILGIAELSGFVYLSNNSGLDWDFIYQFRDADLTGYIGGTFKALFVQAKNGIYVSRDTGQTWESFCGPGNDYDTRMFVTGDTVYAGTVDGKLFVNTYGVSRYNDLLEFSRLKYDFRPPGCLRLDSTIYLTNLSTCEKVKLINVQVVGSSTFGHFAQQLPKTLGATDSIKIFYSPDDLKQDSADLIVTYTIGDSTYEQRIKLKGNGRPGISAAFNRELELLLSSDCAKLDTFVTIKNGPCDSLSLLFVSVTDPATFTLTPPSLPYTVAPNGTINIALDINTVTPGDYVATVSLRIRSGLTIIDTFITLRLKVLTSNEPLVALSKPWVKFDSVSTCEIRYDTLRITNRICKQVVLEFINITYDPAISVIYEPVRPRFLKPDESDSIIIAYAPLSEVPLNATMTIRTGFNPANIRDSVIQLSGFGKAYGNATLSTSDITFPPMLECEENILESWLINHSCDSASIIEIDQPSDAGFSILEPSVPSNIGPGDSVLVKVRVGPISQGSKFDSVVIRIRTRSGAEQFLKLTLLGTVKPKLRSLELAKPLVLDSVAPCSVIDTFVYLTNYGVCDTLIVDSILLSGAPWFSFEPGTLPIIVLPEDSLVVKLRFSPTTNGQSAGSVRFVGDGLDTSVSLMIGTGKYIDPVPMTLSDSSFAAFFCKNAKQTFTLSNPLCDTLIIDGLAITGSTSQFTFTSNPLLPLRIAPGDSAIIEIEFDPNGQGDSSAQFVISSTLYNIVKRTSLTGTYRNTKGTATIETVMAGDGGKTLLIAQGESFTVDIRANDFIEKARDLRSIECELRFNDNVLTVIKTNFRWGKLDGFVQGSGQLIFGQKKTAENISAGQILASVDFYTTIGDSSWSPIDLIVRFNKGDSLYEQCVLEPLSLAPIRIDIDDTCGDAIIRKWINRRLDIFDNFVIVPNPTRGTEEILVSFNLRYQRDITLNLFDANGKKVFSQLYPQLRAGKHEMRLAVPKLSEGWCFVTLEAPEHSDARKLILRK